MTLAGTTGQPFMGVLLGPGVNCCGRRYPANEGYRASFVSSASNRNRPSAVAAR
jgi:hypothetical protein